MTTAAAVRTTASGGLVVDVSIARAHRLTACDVAYVELALRSGCPLATRDQRLRDAADRAGAMTFAG